MLTSDESESELRDEYSAPETDSTFTLEEIRKNIPDLHLIRSDCQTSAFRGALKPELVVKMKKLHLTIEVPKNCRQLGISVLQLTLTVTGTNARKLETMHAFDPTGERADLHFPVQADHHYRIWVS
ncbi:hypothetical protein Ciccas_010207 [Cichlidogyrus casuarinus]|uniref:Uncharacterized protein n=1 Tax=Cichlidogyrus casuarinus TaxID=1844966 RepID=A0ABD2PUS8_9PLAT